MNERQDNKDPSDPERPRKKLKQMYAEGGHALRMRVRDSDLKRIERIKAFYRDHCQLDPSNSILIRRMLADFAVYIEGAPAKAKKGASIVSRERALLIAAVRDK